MNKERLLELADRIEVMPHVETLGGRKAPGKESFDMTTWHCGSAGCIGGWAEKFWGSDVEQDEDNPPFSDNIAMEVLGLTHSQCSALFYPSEESSLSGDVPYSDITPAEAATAIRKLVGTGVVDWSHVEAKD